MKKILSNLVLGTLMAAIVPGFSIAQGIADYSYSKTAKESGLSSAPVDKAAAASIDVPLSKTAIKAMEKDLSVAKANYKATENFNKNYKNATDVSWNTQKDVIVASFSYAGCRSRAVYSKKGNWHYTILNYYEQNMAPSMQAQVKEQFPNFNIHFVQEVTQGSAKVFVIHLENDSTLKKILIRDDEITEYEEFDKSR